MTRFRAAASRRRPEASQPAVTDRDPAGTAPFRALGAVAAGTLLERPHAGARPSEPRDRQCASGSPSGLLSRRAWEAELVDLHGDVPGWYGSDAERERQFARWVQAEAKLLATRLERLSGADVEPVLSRHLGAVAAALWEDAEWARRRLDGSLED